MVQINDDYFEDLTVDSLGEIIERLRNGAEVEPGPQVDRINSAPEGGTDVLTDDALFDGSRNRTCPGLPNLPEAEVIEEPTPEAIGKSEEAPPTNTKREETALVDVKDVAGERPEVAEMDEAERDNLKEIKGIGPVNEGQLNELGIYTFAQVAAWTPANVDWVEDFLSFPGRIAREDWIGQAKILAGGGETDFSKRVEAGEVDSSKDEGE